MGFGVDSFIEVISGAALMWRMSVDAEEQYRERIERVTLRIVGACFLALAAYVRIPMMVMGDSDLIVMVVSERNDHHDRSEATLTL